jgi:hypothetical protein
MQVWGYHGCERAVADRLIAGEAFSSSQNDFDWLGSGAYFWEDNRAQAEHYLRTFKPEMDEPVVIGAIIELGVCADMLNRFWLEQLSASYNDVKQIFDNREEPLPTNKGGRDHVFRSLDRLVIENIIRLRESAGLQRIDTVRAVFEVGQSAFPGSGIKDKTHVQIAVRNTSCIKAVFWPRD